MPTLFCLALLSLAQAHPVSAELTAHQLRLTLDESHATVDYQVWIPNSHLLEDAQPGEPSPIDSRLQEAQTGLSLQVDGNTTVLVSLPLEASPITAGGRVTGFQVALRAELPTDTNTHELVLVNTVEPDEIATYNTEVFVHPSARVSSTSLLDMDGTVVTANRHGQWRMEEEGRELTVVFRTLPRLLRLPGTGRFRPIHKALGAPLLPMAILGFGTLLLVLGTVRCLRARRTR